MNKERIRNAKKSLINDNKFEEKIFNQFGKFDFIPLKNNPIHLSKNDLKQVIKNIKH